MLTLGADEVDLGALPGALVERGLHHLLCEGGPSLARDLLAAGVVDELCATTVPRLVAGDHLRLAHGDARRRTRSSSPGSSRRTAPCSRGGWSADDAPGPARVT